MTLAHQTKRTGLRQARTVLERVRPYTSEQHVFPNYRTAGKPISEDAMLYALYAMGFKEKATVHGFRKTASTLLNEMGYNRDWIEIQLAHSDKDKVRAAYNKAEYLPGRTEMLQHWAGFCDSLKSGNNVIPLRRAS
jgi:integrase